ncbi:hypothetical protein ABPG75_000534 [Micractinium tetrahymenae]
MPTPYKRTALPPDVTDAALQQLRADLFPGERRRLRQQLSLEQPFVVVEVTAESMPPPPPRAPLHALQRQQPLGEQQRNQLQQPLPPGLGRGPASGMPRAAGAQAQWAQRANQELQQPQPQQQQQQQRCAVRASPRELPPTTDICPRCGRPPPTGQQLINARREYDQHTLRLCQNRFVVDSNLQHATPSVTYRPTPEPESPNPSLPFSSPSGQRTDSIPGSLQLCRGELQRAGLSPAALSTEDGEEVLQQQRQQDRGPQGQQQQPQQRREERQQAQRHRPQPQQNSLRGPQRQQQELQPERRLRRLLAARQFGAAFSLIEMALHVEPLRLKAACNTAAAPLEAAEDEEAAAPVEGGGGEQASPVWP